MGWPFEKGMATAETIDILRMLHDEVLDLHRDLPLPVSFFVDGAGRLRWIGKGRVNIQHLLTERSDGGRPFAGRRSD